jgi:hypothetical protein
MAQCGPATAWIDNGGQTRRAGFCENPPLLMAVFLVVAPARRAPLLNANPPSRAAERVLHHTDFDLESFRTELRSLIVMNDPLNCGTINLPFLNRPRSESSQWQVTIANCKNDKKACNHENRFPVMPPQ